MPLQQAVQGSVQRSKARVVLVNKPGTPQTAVRVASGAPDRRNPDIPPLQVMNAVWAACSPAASTTTCAKKKGIPSVRSAFIFHRRHLHDSGQCQNRRDRSAVSEMFKNCAPYRATPIPQRSSRKRAIPRVVTARSVRDRFGHRQQPDQHLHSIWVSILQQASRPAAPSTGASSRRNGEAHQARQFRSVGVGDAVKICRSWCAEPRTDRISRC